MQLVNLLMQLKIYLIGELWNPRSFVATDPSEDLSSFRVHVSFFKNVTF